MKAIVKVRAEEGGLELRDLSVPEPGPNDVLIKMKTLSICGTDLHIYNWDAWSQSRVKLPITIGHEFAGEVVKIGNNVHHIKIGDYVSGEGHLACGFCQQCRTGLGHVCDDWQGLGYDTTGCFAEYLLLPESNVWLNDPELDPIIASIQDPLGNAIHTVFVADCVGKDVAVYGCGPVGLLCIAVLKAIGAARIIAVGRSNEYRLELARKSGATHIIKTSEQDPVEEIRKITGGKGVDVAMEIAGTPQAINAAVRCLRFAGNAVILGIPNEPVPIDMAKDVVFRSVSIRGVTGRRMWDTWYRMKGLLKSGSLKVDHIITHHLPFDDFEKGFQIMKTGNCGKVVLEL